MIKTMAKVAGLLLTIDIAYCLGKGFMMGYVSYVYPEVGEELHETLEEVYNDEARSWFAKCGDVLTLVTEKVICEKYIPKKT